MDKKLVFYRDQEGYSWKHIPYGMETQQLVVIGDKIPEEYQKAYAPKWWRQFPDTTDVKSVLACLWADGTDEFSEQGFPVQREAFKIILAMQGLEKTLATVPYDFLPIRVEGFPGDYHLTALSKDDVFDADAILYNSVSMNDEGIDVSFWEKYINFSQWGFVCQDSEDEVVEFELNSQIVRYVRVGEVVAESVVSFEGTLDEAIEHFRTDLPEDFRVLLDQGEYEIQPLVF